MAYCIRYIFEDEAAPDLASLARRIQTLAGYTLAVEGKAKGELHADSALIGIAELSDVPDPGSSQEVQELLEELEVLEEDDDELDTESVSSRLWNTTGLLRVELQWDGDDPVESLRKLNAIWPLLLADYPGLLYADHEGYYDRDGLVLDLG